MAKTGPLGKAEAFYVEEKFKSGVSVDEIAKDLDRAVSAVEKHVVKAKLDKKPTIVDQQFARQGGATVMTQNASMMIDETRRSKPYNPPCVIKIK